ncbi:MAG: glycosyltransferase family 4 protein [Butyrivibrio sp.]|nr:glycosyltransferase family 4 protein [Butyrivibrio sp.]
MKVLIVCSRRNYSPHTGYMAPFVYEQMKAIQSFGIECKPILVDRGLKGYLKAIAQIRKTIKDYSPDIVHAHYGLCGLLANLQRIIPVITTYHGTDIHDKYLRVVSQISVLLSRRNIVVSDDLAENLFKPLSIRVIPCGVNANLLIPMKKEEACLRLGWDPKKTHILFSKEFYNTAKNYPLARASVDLYNSMYPVTYNAELLEFIGYTREQVLLLYNAVDCVLMTSDHEGSPQFIKEAMACNCPIVSVDVGDVKSVISSTAGCYIAERDPADIAKKLDLAIHFGKTNGRDKVLEKFDSKVIAQKVIKVYEEVLRHE